MLTHRGYSAWITVDDIQLPEYLVAVDAETSKVSCWIPGEPRKSFVVYWHDHGSKIDTCSFITLDGLVVPGKFLPGEGTSRRSGIRISESTERPFTFKEVVDQDVSMTSTIEQSGESGMITVRIKRVDRVIGRPPNPNSTQREPSVGSRRPGDLAIGFGDEQPAHRQFKYTWSVKEHDPSGKHGQKPSTYVSFVFRYRTAAFLKSQGIMPEKPRLAVNTGPEHAHAPIRRVVSAPVTSPATPAAPPFMTNWMPQLPPTVSASTTLSKQNPYPTVLPSQAQPRSGTSTPTTIRASASSTPVHYASVTGPPTPAPTPGTSPTTNAPKRKRTVSSDPHTLAMPVPSQKQATFLRMGPQPPRRGSADKRRTVSWRAVPTLSQQDHFMNYSLAGSPNEVGPVAYTKFGSPQVESPKPTMPR